jgi:heterodisulfide reductase subunit B
LLSEKKRFGLFLGCTIPSSQIFVEKAIRLIGKKLGIDLVELEGTTCCPEPEISKTVSYDGWLRVAARNLSIAEQTSNNLCLICSGCYATFSRANKALKDEATLSEVNNQLQRINRKYNHTVNVMNVVELLHDVVGIERLKSHFVKRMNKAKIATHPGCRILHEKDLVDKMNAVITATGASLLTWKAQEMCCGVPSMYNDPEFALNERAKRKVEDLKTVAPDCLVLVCPACYDMLEKAEISFLDPEQLVPIVNLVELVALAIGISPEEIGMDLHRIEVAPLMEKIA